MIGVYTEAGRPWITSAVVVPSSRSTTHYYELPEGARPAVVKAARAHDPRLGYIGDWHSHPADVGPSGTDLRTMRSLATEGESGCAHPVLLIARRTASGYRIDGRELAVRSVRRLRVIQAGPLPKATTDATADASLKADSDR